MKKAPMSTSRRYTLRATLGTRCTTAAFTAL
jgi:hypothetical protein